MKIYIAGPMTGRENFNREAFNKEAERLTRHGHTVLNPASLPDGLEQREYMDICFAMLCCADAILMLPSWQTSSGATAGTSLCPGKNGASGLYHGSLSAGRIAGKWRLCDHGRTGQEPVSPFRDKSVFYPYKGINPATAECKVAPQCPIHRSHSSK
ncbi:DUF4406 domain-containing protein [Klebsiella pneumoniae]|uniref:DUF4406 domain-containing protein n=3 Tax=Enterobacteriaceae TaxID=543 RepID=UPI001BFCD658